MRLVWVTCERHNVANAEGVELAAECQIRGRHVGAKIDSI
jgi:hypothetical protein